MGLGSGIFGSIVNWIIIIMFILTLVYFIYHKIQDSKIRPYNPNENKEKVENAKFKLIK